MPLALEIRRIESASSLLMGLPELLLRKDSARTPLKACHANVEETHQRSRLKPLTIMTVSRFSDKRESRIAGPSRFSRPTVITTDGKHLPTDSCHHVSAGEAIRLA